MCRITALWRSLASILFLFGYCMEKLIDTPSHILIIIRNETVFQMKCFFNNSHIPATNTSPLNGQVLHCFVFLFVSFMLINLIMHICLNNQLKSVNRTNWFLYLRNIKIYTEMKALLCKTFYIKIPLSVWMNHSEIQM